MRTTRLTLLTGSAAIALAGFATIAPAATPEAHVLTLRLPGGQVEQVRYAGDVPPTVVLAPQSVVTSFAPAAPFALLQQISADMDRQAAALFANMTMLPSSGFGGFGLVPVMSGPGVCSRSIQITFAGTGQAPQVVSHTSGDCGPAPAGAAPAALPNVPAPVRVPAVIRAKADSPWQGLIHPVSDRRP